MPAVNSAVQNAQPQQVSLQSEAEVSILPGAHTQIVIPIRREADVIGLLLLESVSDSQQDVAFLNRLSDHAAIAISNAQLYEEVQQANDAKSEFVSFVAHELKNPMTSIKGYTELLAAGAVGPINEMQTNFLHTIRSNVERMSTLVSDLNDNSKIEAGRLRLDYKAVDLSEVVDEVTRSTSRQIEDKKQEIQLQVPESLPKVWADQTRVSQVLTNLVSNAHKYTPEGGEIIVGAEVSANQWDPEGAAQVVHIWVKDNGIGISVEDQQKIFSKFFRSDDQKAREAPGTGLGLNITKSLVEMQGGKIWFESEFRKGYHLPFHRSGGRGIRNYDISCCCWACASAGRPRSQPASHTSCLKSTLGQLHLGFGIVIASHQYQARDVASGAASLLGDAPLIGFSTPAGLTGAGLHSHSVVVAVLSADDLEVSSHWLPGYAQSSRETASQLNMLVSGKQATKCHIFFADGFNGDAEQFCNSISPMHIPHGGQSVFR